MITTIVHEKLKLEDAATAIVRLGHIAQEVENGLKLKAGFLVTIMISAPSNMDQQSPKGELFVMAPCEIVSFEAGATKATQIIAQLHCSISYKEDGYILFTDEVGASLPERKSVYDAIQILTGLLRKEIYKQSLSE